MNRQLRGALSQICIAALIGIVGLIARAIGAANHDPSLSADNTLPSIARSFGGICLVVALMVLLVSLWQLARGLMPDQDSPTDTR